jgi:hypothetical protein
MIRSIGLDLGQAKDCTALAICEDDGAVWRITSLGHPPLGMPYPAVVERVVALVARLPRPVYLMVDATGVGRPVVDMLRAAGAAPTPVSITHKGRTVRHETGAWSVPKAVLMERMAMAMDQGRLRIVCDETMGRIFAGEARNFVRTVNKLGHGRYAGRRRSHDDLILAVALAIWARAEHRIAKGFIDAA